MISRRQAVTLLGVTVTDALLRRSARTTPHGGSTAPSTQPQTPPLAPGAPRSPERLALIDSFRTRSAAIAERFTAHALPPAEGGMPYRLFRPDAAGALPLVVFLHGSGGQGTDNVRQMSLGNVFGTRVWALPEHQRQFPCYVVAPQTDRGWVRYGPPAPGDSVAQVVPGLGDGARGALAVIDHLVQTLPIDRQRIYLTGQSMGGAGVWHLLAQRPTMFAAAVVCCGSRSMETGAEAGRTPLWNFHGTADRTVPVDVSRARLAALRAAGGRVLGTEYADVDHNVWEWAYTEPALLPWLFGMRRAG